MQSAKATPPSVSVIVNTNGRCASLANLVECLRFQRFENFELCIVCGPQDDGSRELAGTWQAAGEIKLAFCEEAKPVGFAQRRPGDRGRRPRRLHRRRRAARTGMAVPAGGGAGVRRCRRSGRMGLRTERPASAVRRSSCNRFGISVQGLGGPADAGAFPQSPSFPHFMGTNCMFRRDAVTALGGFDEAYQYYLEETAICAAAWSIAGSACASSVARRSTTSFFRERCAMLRASP